MHCIRYYISDTKGGSLYANSLFGCLEVMRICFDREHLKQKNPEVSNFLFVVVEIHTRLVWVGVEFYGHMQFERLLGYLDIAVSKSFPEVDKNLRVSSREYPAFT